MKLQKLGLSEKPLSQDVRKFGFYLDLKALLPGDLILVSNIKPKWTHKIINSVQESLGFNEEDARWHHAAVYLGNGDICEADTDGMGASQIRKTFKLLTK